MSVAFIVVKRGYHKLSLKVHPDRVHGDGKKTATEKFQVLGKIYCILSDKDKRAVYDETGEVQNVNNYVLLLVHVYNVHINSPYQDSL